MLTFSATGDGGGGGAPSAADERPRQRSLARLQRTLAMRQGRAEGPWRSELLTAQMSSWVVWWISRQV